MVNVFFTDKLKEKFQEVRSTFVLLKSILGEFQVLEKKTPKEKYCEV